MNTRRAITVKHTLVVAAVAALVATPASFASAADTLAETAAPRDATADGIATGARYQLVDAHGDVVGELLVETGTRLRLRPIGTTTAIRTAQKSAVSANPDRTFHPDYSKALTIGQQSAAWQAELDRINPPPITGGG